MFNSNASSADAGGVPYIEDVFSTWLYTGNGSTQTITNGIDLAGKGGLVWGKSRQSGTSHELVDTVRGGGNGLRSNQTGGTTSTDITGFTASGFTLGFVSGDTNQPGESYASWTFREQPKFFDVVTYTGNGATQNIAHSLGSVPGCIIVKRTDDAGDWWVYHRSLTNAQYLRLNLTNAVGSSAGLWDSTTPTSTQFTVGAATANTSGGTYVAYVFAHDAGGFGLTGTDNVISCGSYTGNGSTTGPVVTLGYEPQWIMLKNASAATDWVILDTMRGLVVGGTDRELNPNQSSAESGAVYITPTATGFQLNTTNGAYNASGNTFIYMAIRRGPMKVPTDATKVFDVGTRSGSGSVAKTNSNVLTDLAVIKNRTSGGEYWAWTPRLAGNQTLQSNSTDAELTGAMATNPWDTMTGAFCAAGNGATNSGSLIDYSFRRAPSFFDEVCYTGDGNTNRAVPHNLTVTPELAIFKNRTTAAYNWVVKTTATFGTNSYLILEGASPLLTNAYYGATATASQITLSTGGFNTGDWNASGDNYVAYLFATVAGVSKVGTYTGTATTQVINCGFTGGARFVLIKRTDSTGDWYVWDSARGIVAGNDPYLLLNSTAAEVTGTDYVDTAASGFELTATAPAAINASGGSYIFLAIA